MTGRAAVIGIGMVGGSVAAALRKQGWHVTGHDIDADRCAEALGRNIIDAVGVDDDAEITFVATPVSAVAKAAEEALSRGGIVTDVGSVKGSVTEAIDHERFVAGHPMAGSEKAGLDGVDPDLFAGATWVLTPSPRTDPEAYLKVRNIVSSLGAEVVTLDADEHDEMVATISHVPHLVASAIMSEAMQRAHAHDAVLRLAAGGFRDMTRIAAGHAGLWADIASENRDAIIETLARLTTTLDEVSEMLAAGKRDDLEAWLASAAVARRELPLRQGRPSELASVSVVIPDRPGALGQVLGLFGDLRVNVEDIEINHAVKGGQGTLMLTVGAASAAKAKEALASAGFTASVEAL